MWGDAKLGSNAKRIIDRNVGRSALISAISFCEIRFLLRGGRIDLNGRTAKEFRDHALAGGFIEKPMDGAIAIDAVDLALPHRDPADRIIVATARAFGAVLLTADEKLLASDAVETEDART
ncbi:type II toxin-antitoxin system VapC family toxin [Pendulispora brunnea]|uniref:Type II toxin-antitoxin system VapC family toxin n=1 Tax=Pendulispora brunnea TaxID=2905690 RepID=A0ABZ2KTM4_9BACT